MANQARFRAAETALWKSVGITPIERTVTLASTGSVVRAQEVGDGPPIVYIHGASNAGASWATLVARLPQFRNILIDRPGCGLSERLARPLTDVRDLEAFADSFLIDVLDGLGLDSTYVVGTSFGGYVAVRGVASAPDRVDKLVLMGWPAGAPMKHTPFVMRLAQLPAVGKRVAMVPPPRSAVKAMLKQIGLKNALANGGFSQDALTWFQSLLRDTTTMRNEIEGLPPLNNLNGPNAAMLHTDDVLRRITTPTYLLWGTDDPMGDEAIARPFTALFPNAELEMMSGAGHAPWMDDASAVAARVIAFFA